MFVSDQHENRLHFLLLVRVLATFAVVFGHASGFYQAFTFTQWPNFPYIQSIAVTVFFCVSGYTIAWVCDRSQTSGLSGLGRFAFNRIARLHIPLVPLLLASAIIEPLLLGDSHPQKETLTLWTWVGNVLFMQWRIPDIGSFAYNPEVPVFGLNRPLWTLAVEFWTYILFAGAFFGLRSRSRQFLPILASFAAAAILGVTLCGGIGDGLPIIWLMSAAAYFILKRLPPIEPSIQIGAAALLVPSFALLFVPAVWPATGDYSIPFNLMVLVNFLLAMVAMSGRRVASGATLTFFASFAYSTYIIHYPLLYLLHQTGWLSGAAGVILATAICFTCGWLYSLPLERRYRRIRDSIRQWMSRLFASVGVFTNPQRP